MTEYILQIRTEQGEVFEHPLKGSQIAVGRAPDNDVVLEHPAVAEHHLRIEAAPPGAATPFVIVDLSARSGTLYQGQRMAAQQPMAVPLKDPFSVGPYMLRLTQREAQVAVSPQPAVAGKDRRVMWLATAGFALALLSLLLNLVLVLRLGQVSRLGREVALEARGAFDKTQSEGINLIVDISQAIPVAVDVPVEETFNVRVQHDLVINETVQSQVTIPVVDRTVTLDIPIRATIPLDLDIPVHFGTTVNFQEDVSIDVALPLHLDPEAMGFGPLMEKIEGWLERLQQIL